MNTINKLLCILFVVIVFTPGVALSKHIHKEKWYQDQWCAGRGSTEVVRMDHTRCDCLTPTNAVEVDFAKKFYEAIGQSLYYSMQTGHRAGVLLILESPADRTYWDRLNSVVERFNLPIDLWKIEDVHQN